MAVQVVFTGMTPSPPWTDHRPRQQTQFAHGGVDRCRACPAARPPRPGAASVHGAPPHV